MTAKTRNKIFKAVCTRIRLKLQLTYTVIMK